MFVNVLKQIIGLLLLINCSTAFYIPGVAPREYEEHEIVEIKVDYVLLLLFVACFS